MTANTAKIIKRHSRKILDALTGWREDAARHGYPSTGIDPERRAVIVLVRDGRRYSAIPQYRTEPVGAEIDCTTGLMADYDWAVVAQVA